MRRTVYGLLILGAVLAALSVAGAALAVGRCARGLTYTAIAAVPHRPVGVVLGCTPALADGRPNLFFRYRIDAAAALYRAGKVDFLLVSGDNHRRGHDEPSEMKAALLERGVPVDRIYCDYAGFRTLDSIVRAREVFGQPRITVISQRFHNERAIFIARRRGVDAIGVNAQDVKGVNSIRTRCREQLARVRTVLDVCVLGTRPRFMGPRVEIGLATPQAYPNAGAVHPSRKG